MKPFTRLCIAAAIAVGVGIAITGGQNPAAPPAPNTSGQLTATAAASPAMGATEKAISQDATIGLIGTLVGAIIGAFVSVLAVYLTSKQQRLHEAAARAEQYQTALSLVQAEIDHNLSVLTEYLKEISLENPIRTAANQSGQGWIASRPAPSWSTLAWEHSLTDFLGAMPQETLLQAFSLYSELRAFTQATELAASYYNQGLPNDVVSTAFFVHNQLADKIQRAGNPLR